MDSKCPNPSFCHLESRLLLALSYNTSLNLANLKVSSFTSASSWQIQSNLHPEFPFLFASVNVAFKWLLCTYLLNNYNNNLLVATYTLLVSKLVKPCDLRDLESPFAISRALALHTHEATAEGLRDSKSRTLVSLSKQFVA